MDFALSQLAGFGHAFWALAVDPATYLYLVASVFLGIAFGALPGLTATLAVTILTGFFGNKIPLDYALIALLGAYVGAIYGGSYPSILLNIPGTAASAATAMDGYPLARAGRGGEALGLTTTASFIGTVIGTFALLICVWALLLISKSIASPEKALLALFGILLSGTLMSEDLAIKGWISGLIGLGMAMVGLDPLLSEPRYTFGWSYLMSGFQVVPALMGAFAVPQIIDGLRHVELGQLAELKGRILPNWRAMRRYMPAIARSGVIGSGAGALPGVGEDVAGWVSYGVGKAVSSEGRSFGKGSVEGLLCSETANNACIGGALIPLLVLGIPGSPPAAALMGAFKINNVIPGPTIDPEIILRVVAILVLASFTMFVMGLFTARIFIRILKIPQTVFLPVVMVLTAIGSFSVGGGVNDLYLMLGVGFAAYFMNLMKYPIAPLVIGVILGGLLDESLRRSLFLSDGDLSVLVSRPGAAILAALNLALIVSQVPAAKRAFARVKGKIA
ncbi:tripartite tricarboxylate transporter permease [Oceanicella actignis]|uniref:Putative tricarboxylic transport membrane protein n=1 Tax=Oceanicella actignis TaxID=1189325 RepID=A0A1M7T7Q3_9RHOB|nr:tripartite tricarboxylate transporter permease [Oceanicella actignis]SET48047.1 putative tricarboxylic transport membrane protein [Oceanicella actignis]SHN66682.1 putative tricarboxylic transport membrane protein [Oceanicella actignis]